MRKLTIKGANIKENMYIVKITDGLGNQLFQYAFAKSLQIKYNKRVCLDTRYINREDETDNKAFVDFMAKCDKREYKLDKYCISLDKAVEKDLKKFSKTKKSIFWNYCNLLHILSNQVLYENNINSFNLWWYQNIYYIGCFFDKKYYEDNLEIIKSDLKLKKDVVIDKKLTNILKKEETIGVHVRRGDFLRVGRTVCNIGYYQKAYETIRQKVENPYVIIISDDIEWVKANIKFDAPMEFVSGKGYQDYEELFIYSCCKHNIIANSTFSYWGAVLNPNDKKIVVAPKHWRDRILFDDWIKIENS